MTAFNELAIQCEKRFWRLSIDGTYPDGRYEAGLILNRLEVRTRHGRELLASVSFDPLAPDEAAVDAARALHQQGLIV